MYSNNFYYNILFDIKHIILKPEDSSMTKKPIKQVFLWGGLGNVLYQINLAYYLSQKGYYVLLNRGLIDYNNRLLRKLLKIHNGIYSQASMFVDTSKINIVDKLNFKDIINIILFKVGISTKKFKYFNHEWPTDHEIFSIDNFFGYFQKTKFISSQISLAFKSKFKPKSDDLLLNLVKNCETIVVHARFADKIDLKEFELCYSNLSYIFDDFASIVIVTDDEKNARLMKFTNIKKKKIIVISSPDLIDDFHLISMAKNVVLSRSSFSWWATEISSTKQFIFQPEPLYLHLDWQHYSNKKRIPLNF
jgi:hypothetical protein